MKTAIFLLIVAVAGKAWAIDLHTRDGAVFLDARVEPITPLEISVFHASGVARLAYADLTPASRVAAGYDKVAAKAYLADLEQRRRAADEAARKAERERREYRRLVAKWREQMRPVFEARAAREAERRVMEAAAESKRRARAVVEAQAAQARALARRGHINLVVGQVPGKVFSAELIRWRDHKTIFFEPIDASGRVRITVEPGDYRLKIYGPSDGRDVCLAKDTLIVEPGATVSRSVSWK